MAGEKIGVHIFKFVERELYNYPVNKKLVESWERESQDITEGTKSALANVGPDQTGRFSQNLITNPTSAKALRLVAMAYKVDRARWFVEAIDDVMGMLDEADSELIRLKYFQGFLKDPGIWRTLHLEMRTFYNRRNEIVAKIALRMGLL